MPSSEDATTVTRNDEAGRYEIQVGDVLAGFTEFRADAEGRLLFPHTKVDPAFGGRGLGKILVAEALHDVAERGETIIPHCPFVIRYLEQNTVDGLSVQMPEHTHPASFNEQNR